MQLLHRAHTPSPDKKGLGLLLVTIVLGFFLALQLGLIIWMYVNQWR